VVVRINSHTRDVAKYEAFRENRPPVHDLIWSVGPLGWLPGRLFFLFRRAPPLILCGQNESSRKREYKGFDDNRSVWHPGLAFRNALPPAVGDLQPYELSCEETERFNHRGLGGRNRNWKFGFPPARFK
jgi:hypothetical protein